MRFGWVCQSSWARWSPDRAVPVQGENMEVELVKGSRVTVTTDEAYKERCDQSVIWVDYRNLARVVKVGRKIFVDDGLISLVVKEIGTSPSALPPAHPRVAQGTPNPGLCPQNSDHHLPSPGWYRALAECLHLPQCPPPPAQLYATSPCSALFFSPYHGYVAPASPHWGAHPSPCPCAPRTPQGLELPLSLPQAPTAA